MPDGNAQIAQTPFAAHLSCLYLLPIIGWFVLLCHMPSDTDSYNLDTRAMPHGSGHSAIDFAAMKGSCMRHMASDTAASSWSSVTVRKGDV
jgi:hypothetical protein